MTLAFILSMPGCGSWNGRWSGEGKKYAKVETFPRTKKAAMKAAEIVKTGYYRYSFGDGWAAGVTVKQVDAAEARQLRAASQGFCGYDWMVASIIREGKIVP